ncbi:SAM-dependent methyltransferase [Alcaligenaceae bacterium CGII-47]|nr:SAM-dependent methyltransferase [Alcaligenaceae bacterium CGII-47]
MSTLPVVTLPSGLPALDPESLAHGRQIAFYLTERIQAAGGWMAFEDWMQAALYTPGLGYYSAGSTKFSHAGDFTTAPEISPLFGQTLARQVAQILRAVDSTNVLEFGAGSGALAAALIPALQDMGLFVNYQIIELSADLRTRQATRLAHVQPAVQWHDTLPEAFSGCVLANEVLDAMPATLFRWNEAGALMQLGVSLNKLTDAISPFCYAERPAPDVLAGQIAPRMPPLPAYRSEINLQAEAWVRQMGQWLTRGAALLIDYGFPQHEYYHPQRAQGTLMCHFRHHAHDQALVLAGLQDITTHVDFTAMADAALEGGLDVMGYTSQARFLMNAGLTDLIRSPGEDSTARARQLTAFNTLVSEAEMGELFKVLAVGRGLDEALLGFVPGDRRDRL